MLWGSKREEELFFFENGGSLEQAVHRVGVVSVPGVAQNPPGCYSVQPALGELAVTGELDYIMSSGPFLAL